MKSQLLKNLVLVVFLFSMGACSTKKILEVENADQQLKMDQYERNLKLKITESGPTELKVVQIKAPEKSTLPEIMRPKKESAKPEAKKVVPKPTKIAKHLPELEGSVGFNGRRPIVDPFVVGERVRLKLSYFNVVAGYMDVEVLPFVEVNGRKSYHLQITGKSNSFFSNIYSVDDKAETFLDYETMTPYNMSISVKETKQLREIRSYFDWKKKKCFYWEKKITKKSGLEERNFNWDIMPYSQNVFSAVFYMRTFTLIPGQTISFRVADEKKNMVVKGHVLKRETLTTALGEIKTIKMKPEIEIEGIFKPIGEVYFWMTDDDRKLIVRIESKIKIGTIVASLDELVR